MILSDPILVVTIESPSFFSDHFYLISQVGDGSSNIASSSTDTGTNTPGPRTVLNISLPMSHLFDTLGNVGIITTALKTASHVAGPPATKAL